MIKTHTTIGAQILSGSQAFLLQTAEEIALTHHERWDGAGYPAGLAGDDIPLSGRIVAVADVFDALTHDRPYKQAWPLDQTLDEINDQSGRHFDPAVIEAFLTLDHHALLQPPATDSALPLADNPNNGHPARANGRQENQGLKQTADR